MKDLKKIKINTGDYITTLYNKIKIHIVLLDNGKLSITDISYTYMEENYDIKISDDIRNNINIILSKIDKYNTKDYNKINDLFDKFYIELQN